MSLGMVVFGESRNLDAIRHQSRLCSYQVVVAIARFFVNLGNGFGLAITPTNFAAWLDAECDPGSFRTLNKDHVPAGDLQGFEFWTHRSERMESAYSVGGTGGRLSQIGNHWEKELDLLVGHPEWAWYPFLFLNRSLERPENASCLCDHR